MDRRLLLGGALLVLVALAGCSWVQDSQPATVTREESPDTGASVPAYRLRNHTRALANTSYAVEMRINVSTNNSRIDRAFTVRSDPAAERQRADLVAPDAETDRYVANGTIFTRLTANGTVDYDVRDVEQFNVSFGALHRRSVSQGRLAGIYQFGEFEQTGTVARNGRTLTEFELAETPLTENATVESSSGRIRIDEAGVIRNATIDIVGTQNGERFFLHVDYRVTATGSVTVSQPDWLDEARANASANGTATPAPTSTPGG